MVKGLFVGLITLDLIYSITQYPQENQKIVASDYTVAAGGQRLMPPLLLIV